jgi:hypothetical protein
VGDGPAVRAGGATAPRRAARPLLTEEDVLAAYRAGTVPALAGAILTPYARDALSKHFPELLKDI